MNSNAALAVNQVTPESLPVLAYDGKPVVTTAVLAELYGTEAIRIRQNHSNNRARFEVGKHFYKVEGKELSDLRVSLNDSQIPAKARAAILWTERGAARHAKMLETNAAWDVFEKLEDHYFGKVEQAQPKALPSPLTPSHQREIQKAIASRVYTLPEPARPAAFKRVYSKLKDRFEVGTYKDIDDSRYSEVLRTIETVTLEGEWLPQEQAHSQLSEADLLNLRCLCVHAVNIAHHWRDEIGPAVKALNEPLYNRVTEKVHVASRIAGNFALALDHGGTSH